MSGNMFDEVEYAPEEEFESEEIDAGAAAADEYLEDEYAASPQDSRLSEAMKKLEKAQLYQILINQSVFGPDSARPEVLSEVDAELREFADRRLNVLLGMEQEKTQPQGQVELPFSDEEIDALQQLAKRLVTKIKAESAPPVPTVRQVQVPATKPSVAQPAVRRAAARPSTPAVKKVQGPAATRQAPPQRRPQPPAKAAPRRKTKTANVGEKTGQDYGQAGNPKALPMPSPEAMMRLETVKAASAEQSMHGSDIGNLLLAAARISQHNNRHEVE